MFPTDVSVVVPWADGCVDDGRWVDLGNRGVDEWRKDEYVGHDEWVSERIGGLPMGGWMDG